MPAVVTPETVEQARANPRHRTYEPHGGCLKIIKCRDRYVLAEGPANTGKSRACLERLHAACRKYPGMAGLMVRKHRASLTQTAMRTFDDHVVAPADGVRFLGYKQEYRYPNGSFIVVSGLRSEEDAAKLMSAEFDMAYVQEATELREADYEYLDTRLRAGVMPYQQLLVDCNPGPPTHWLNQRANQGHVTRILTRHGDNPTITQEYLEALSRLTGARRERLYLGKWTQAEGTVHEGWDPAVHVIEPFDIPEQWTRYWVIDFGFTNPFVWQAWAEDGDGRLFLYHEIYRTGWLVEDFARQIMEVTEGEPKAKAVICDHDAEGRATLNKHLRARRTTSAIKTVTTGLQAVDVRLRKAGDGRPRLFIFDGCLIGRDPELDARKLPACTAEEMDGYIWGESRAGLKEEPLKQNDHGNDAMRYMVAHLDLRRRWKAVR